MYWLHSNGTYRSLILIVLDPKVVTFVRPGNQGIKILIYTKSSYLVILQRQSSSLEEQFLNKLNICS